MRVETIQEYDETRDALSHDWIRFMANAFPDTSWIPMPNVGSDAGAFLDAWAITHVILSGGNDIGQSVVRDKTECAVLDRALAQGIPVLGICRGLQMMQHYFKGKLVECTGHAGTRHKISLGNVARDINSFHNWTIANPAPGLIPTAVDEQGFIEAMEHVSAPIKGIMWHPERETKPDALDVEMIRTHFNWKAS